MAGKHIVKWGLQRYWRLSRAMTLGAQGCVLDANNRVLLIRHTHFAGWHFPGGGIETGESAETALGRELVEEAGIVIEGRPRLFGIYDNHANFPGDHIVLYVVRSWRQPSVPAPNREIAAQAFYDAKSLPADIHPPTARRIAEILNDRRPDQLW